MAGQAIRIHEMCVISSSGIPMIERLCVTDFTNAIIVWSAMHIVDFMIEKNCSIRAFGGLDYVANEIVRIL